MIIKRCGTRDAKNVCELMEFGINWIGFDFRLNSPNFVRQISSRAGIIPDYGSRAAALGKETEKNGFIERKVLCNALAYLQMICTKYSNSSSKFLS